MVLRRMSRILALTLGCSLLLAMLAACGAGTSTGNGNSGGKTSGTITIKIGSEFPTTAKDAASGLPAQNGVAYAVNEADSENFLPGYKFVLDPKNDVGPSGTHDPTVGQKNVNDLIGDAQVAGIVGPLNSSIAQAEMPAANSAPIALISPANTNDCLTQNTPAYECGGANSRITQLRPTGKVTYFRTATLDKFQGAALAAFAISKQYKTAYVIDDTETYGVGLATNFSTDFKLLGGTVLGRKSIASTNSYENVLTQIASQKPQVIFFGGNDSTGGITIRQQMARVPGLQSTPFMVGDGAKTSTLAKEISPIEGNGPVYATIPGEDPTQVPAAQTFLTKYTKQYGTPGAYSTGGYDDAWIVMQAIKRVISGKEATVPANAGDTANAQKFRQAVINEVAKTNYNGLTGPQSFDANGDTTNRSISVYTIGKNVNVGDGWQFLTAVKPTIG